MIPSILFSLFALPLVSSKLHAFNRTSKPHASSPRTTMNAAGSSFVSAAWYAAWHEQDFPPAVVSWDKYTHLTYSFALVSLSSYILLLLGDVRTSFNIIPLAVSLPLM